MAVFDPMILRISLVVFHWIPWDTGKKLWCQLWCFNKTWRKISVFRAWCPNITQLLGKKGDILVIFNRYLKDLESEVRHPKNRSRTVTNLLSAATSSQYFRCSQVKRLGKRPVLWEDSFDQGIRLPAGVFRWQDDNRAVVHERKHGDVDVNCGGAALGV